MNAPRSRYDRRKPNREQTPDRDAAAGGHRRRSALTALVALAAFTALAAFIALLSTGATAEAADTVGRTAEPTVVKQQDSVCEDGYHYAYEAVNVYLTSRGRLQYTNDVPAARPTTGEDEEDASFTRFGLEWRDYCLSDELVDIPSGTPGEPGPTRKGHRAYQPRSIEDLCVTRALSVSACAGITATRYRPLSVADRCATGRLSVSACAEITATQRAAVLRHPEIRAVLHGQPQSANFPDWSPPGGWPSWLIEHGNLTETQLANTPQARQAAAEGPRLNCEARQEGALDYRERGGPNGEPVPGHAAGIEDHNCSTAAGQRAVLEAHDNRWGE